MTGIAESLAASGIPVRVLCANPLPHGQGDSVLPARETLSGVQIRRISSPAVDKNHFLQRLWMLVSLTARFAAALIGEIRRGDSILVVTNPPTLPLVVSVIASLRGAKSYLLVHDVYPDVLVPTGLVSSDAIVYRILDRVQQFFLPRFERIIVLGRDMKTRLLGKVPGLAGRVEIIPNWGDIDEVRCLPRTGNPLREQLGWSNEFVIQFSGNIGRTHGVDDFLDLAMRLRDEPRVKFLVYGSGAGRAQIERVISRGALPNVALLPPCQRTDLAVYLNACDLFFMPFKPGMEGISVPSRLYNVLAAGNPVLAAAHRDSELARVVREEECGWVVEPGDIESMTKIVRGAITVPDTLSRMRLRARDAAEAKYSHARVTSDYAALFGNDPGR